jgi:hypothetical protein
MLADRLKMTVAELGDRMSAAEATQWYALHLVEHDEQEKADRKASRKGR